MSSSSKKKEDDHQDLISRRLSRARSLLLSTSLYLGDDFQNIKDHALWKRIGLGNRLVTKESFISDSNRSKSDTEDIPDSLLEPALLSVIVKINPENCWVTPCGYWKGPTKGTKKFEDLKLSIQGECPSYDFLTQDFESVVNNLKLFMENVAIPGSKTTGFLIGSKESGYAFRFRHVVFKVSTSPK